MEISMQYYLTVTIACFVVGLCFLIAYITGNKKKRKKYVVVSMLYIVNGVIGIIATIIQSPGTIFFTVFFAFFIFTIYKAIDCSKIRLSYNENVKAICKAYNAYEYEYGGGFLGVVFKYKYNDKEYEEEILYPINLMKKVQKRYPEGEERFILIKKEKPEECIIPEKFDSSFYKGLYISAFLLVVTYLGFLSYILDTWLF